MGNVATGAPEKVRPKESALHIVRAAHLSNFLWLVHGFSTRVGGFSRTYGGRTLNLGFTRDDTRGAVEHNRNAFLRALAAASGRPNRGATRPSQNWPLITLRQVHSDLIHFVDAIPEHPLVGDGI